MNRRDAIAALVSLPATVTITAAEVGPTDVIVVECDEYLGSIQAAQIREVLARAWPGRKAIVLDRGMRLRIAKG